jgi:hypothetical protein
MSRVRLLKLDDQVGRFEIFSCRPFSTVVPGLNTTVLSFLLLAVADMLCIYEILVLSFVRGASSKKIPETDMSFAV